MVAFVARAPFVDTRAPGAALTFVVPQHKAPSMTPPRAAVLACARPRRLINRLGMEAYMRPFKARYRAGSFTLLSGRTSERSSSRIYSRDPTIIHR